MKILIIGGGNMGKSFAQSFINASLVKIEDLYIIEKNKRQIELLKEEGILNIKTSFGDFIKDISMIVLATKPQDINPIYDNLKPYLNKDSVILSIMAGIPIQAIQKNLETEKVVRCMPNLACQIGAGVTGYFIDESIGQQDANFIIQLLNSTGVSIKLSKEDQLNAITAISGSGPAYVFYFMQSMIEQAKDYGFSVEDAEKIVAQTFLGAINLFQENDISNQEWILRVASKGGTTEAAIAVFNQENIDKNIQKGINAAFSRSRELSQK